MKLIRTNIADGKTTIHEQEIRQFSINRNKSGKLVYWYEDDFGNGGYPEAIVTECRVTDNAVYLTVNWDDEEEEEEEEDDDYSDSYEDYGDIEMGFNPYMGCYDYDC